MKLWLLEAIEDLPTGNDPWEPWYDTAAGFVVRAGTETDARKFAHKHGGAEKEHHGIRPWLNPKYSTCLELVPDGDPGVVIRDFQAA